MSSKKKQSLEKIKCPQCNRYEAVGFLGGNTTKRYFCCECCIEFNIKGNCIEMFDITSGGTMNKK
ncbi:MAG: hypothetical protein N2749_00850 [Clostridia bacterium]|nr:hypothetical protein [Clostridia bacterium]